MGVLAGVLAGSVVFATGLIWLGYTLWSVRGVSPQPTTHPAIPPAMTTLASFLTFSAAVTAVIITISILIAFFARGGVFEGGHVPGGVFEGGGGGSGGGFNPPAPKGSETVDMALDALERSNIAFNTPTQMQLGETTTIRLLMSPSASVEELRHQIRESGAPGQQIQSAEQIITGSAMQTQLTGQDFEIVANSPEVQAISYKEPTEWTWDVSPTERGKKQLHLTIIAVFKVEGEEATRQIESFDRTITVNVTWNQRLSGFISTNWEWLWTAILVPLVPWLWRKWKKTWDKGESAHPSSPKRDT